MQNKTSTPPKTTLQNQTHNNIKAITGAEDLAALLDHANRLGELVFNSVSHSNEMSNVTIAVVGVFFYPLTFVAGIYGCARVCVCRGEGDNQNTTKNNN
jgi:Mg2+ and Co2+ transporter CorA